MSKKSTVLLILLLVLCIGVLFGRGLPDVAKNAPEPFTYRLPDAEARVKAEAVKPDIELEFIGSCLWSQAKDVWADDFYLFVLFHNTLVVYNMYYYDEPTYYCHVYFPGAAESFHRNGDFFYIAAGYDGLFIIDVAMTVQDPYLVGHYNTPGFAREVVVSGGKAYIADGDSGLQMINVNFPENPIYSGSYTQLGYTANVAVNGDLVYVSDTLTSLHIVQFIEPSFPLKLGEYSSPARIHDIEVVDTLAYLATEFSYGLQIVNVSQSNNPVWLSTYSVAWKIFDLFIKDSLAYFPNGDGDFEIVNISDPENPAFIGDIRQCGGMYSFEQKLYVHHTTLFSNYIGMEGCSGMCIIDTYNPASPSYVGTLSYCWQPCDVEVVDSLLYTANYTGGLEIFNIKNPSKPVYRGGNYTSGYACGVQVRDTIAFVAAAYQGLEVHNVSDPTAPIYQGAFFAGVVSWSYDVLVLGDLAYLPAGYGVYGGLCIIDISDLEDPFLLSRYGDGASCVVVKDNLAYYTDFWDGMRIIDISNPGLPTWAGDYLLPGYTYTIEVKDTLAFVTNDSGLYIADISDPEDVTTLYLYRTPGRALGIALRDSLAYVTDEVYGLQVLDISDPTAPVLLGGYNSPAQGISVTFKDSLIFLADWYSVIILDDPFYVPCCEGRTGNVDCSEVEEPDISDITRLIDYLYLSHLPLCCPEEADCDGSGGEPDISDITAVISHLYIAHEPLAECP